MHVLAYAMGFPAVKATEKAQQQCVDSVLITVERTLAQQKTVREGIRAGRIRVDQLVDDALQATRRNGNGQATG